MSVMMNEFERLICKAYRRAMLAKGTTYAITTWDDRVCFQCDAVEDADGRRGDWTCGNCGMKHKGGVEE